MVAAVVGPPTAPPTPPPPTVVEVANQLPGPAEVAPPPELTAPLDAQGNDTKADASPPAEASAMQDSNDTGSPASPEDSKLSSAPVPPGRLPGVAPAAPDSPSPEPLADNSVATLRELVIRRDPELALKIPLIPAMYPGREEGAAVLIELLAAATAPPEPASRPGAGQLTDRELMGSIIHGLAGNGSPAAWQALHEITAGSTARPLPPDVNTELFVTAILRQLQPETEELRQILLAIVQQSSGLPSSGHAAALQVLARAAREVLSKHTGISLEPSPSDAAAGPGLPGGGDMPAGPGGASGPGLVPGGGFGLGLQGRSNDNQPRLSMQLTDEAENLLWSPEFAAAVSEQLGMVTSLQKSARLLELAGNLPLNPVREALLATLTRLKDQGIASLSPTQIADPGMIITLNRVLSSELTRDNLSAAGSPARSWMQFNSEQISRWRDWMSAMSATEGRLTPAFDDFPIQPHRGAAFDYAGRLTIIAPSGDAASGISSQTTVCYARLRAPADRGSSQWKRMLQHYQTVSSGTIHDSSTSLEIRIEGARTISGSRRRSINVRLHNPIAGGLIEVLIVEAADPKSTPPKPSP
ncbi:MAG: hypothetical protein ACKO2P_20805 [Planctomycetota bacterium]